MTDRELLEKAIYWFKIIAEDMERITTGNLPHCAATTKGRAIRAYEFLEKHKEESVSEELEEAAVDALESISNKYDLISVGSGLEMFKLGAKWGKHQAEVEIQAQSMALVHGCPKESITEELEKAANAYISNENNYSHLRTDTFKAGARWQKEQMMKEAVESKVTITSKGILLEDLRIEDFDYEDKVKLIVIKEE